MVYVDWGCGYYRDLLGTHQNDRVLVFQTACVSRNSRESDGFGICALTS